VYLPLGEDPQWISEKRCVYYQQEGGGLKSLAISDQLVQYFYSFYIETKNGEITRV